MPSPGSGVGGRDDTASPVERHATALIRYGEIPATRVGAVVLDRGHHDPFPDDAELPHVTGGIPCRFQLVTGLEAVSILPRERRRVAVSASVGQRLAAEEQRVARGYHIRHPEVAGIDDDQLRE